MSVDGPTFAAGVMALRSLGRLLPMVMMLAACEAHGPQPQSGFAFTDYAALKLATPAGRETRGGNLAGGATAALAPANLRYGKDTAAVSATYPLDDVLRGYRWTFARLVRVTEAELAELERRGQISAELAAYLRGPAPEINPAVRGDAIGFGRVRAGGALHYQLVAAEMVWTVERSVDGAAYRLVDPVARAYLAALPLGDRRGGDAVDFSFEVGADFLVGHERVEETVLEAALPGVRPSLTRVEGDRVMPAAERNFGKFATGWAANSGQNYSVTIAVRETLPQR